MPAEILTAGEIRELTATVKVQKRIILGYQKALAKEQAKNRALAKASLAYVAAVDVYKQCVDKEKAATKRVNNDLYNRMMAEQQAAQQRNLRELQIVEYGPGEKPPEWVLCKRCDTPSVRAGGADGLCMRCAAEPEYNTNPCINCAGEGRTWHLGWRVFCSRCGGSGRDPEPV